MSEKLKLNQNNPEDASSVDSADSYDWDDLATEFTAKPSADYLNDVDLPSSTSSEATPEDPTDDELDLTIDDLFAEPDPAAADELLASARADSEPVRLNNLDTDFDLYPSSTDYDFANQLSPSESDAANRPKSPEHVLHIPITEITDDSSESHTSGSETNSLPDTVKDFITQHDGHPTARELAPHWKDLVSSYESSALASIPADSEFHLNPEDTLVNSFARAYQPTPTEMIQQFSDHTNQLAQNELKKSASHQDAELIARLQTENEALKAAASSLERNPDFDAKTALEDVVGRFATSQDASDLNIARAAAHLAESYDRRAKPASFALGRQVAENARRLSHSQSRPHPKRSKKRTLDPALI